MACFPLALGMFILMTNISPSAACPESCFCIDTFVTCSDFQYLDLTMLPSGTDTLVLTKGEVEEIPPGFLATATNLKMLEIISVNVRVVRGSAFRGLRNMDLFSITSSSFDIVEPDGFSGLTEISKFHISESRFGRVGKHAFGYINNVLDFRVWSSSFEMISDEAFFELTGVASFQLYHSNITSMGTNVFLGAFRIDEVGINLNRFQTIAEGSLENIASATNRMMLQSNTFTCSCEMAWFLNKPILEEYLPFNHCVFPGKLQPGYGSFKMIDITKEDLCSTVPTVDVVKVTPYTKVDVGLANVEDDFVIAEEMLDPFIAGDEISHTELVMSTLTSRLISVLTDSTTVSSNPTIRTSESSTSSVSLSSLPPMLSLSSASQSSSLPLIPSTSPSSPLPSSSLAHMPSTSASSLNSSAPLLSLLVLSSSLPQSSSSLSLSSSASPSTQFTSSSTPSSPLSSSPSTLLPVSSPTSYSSPSSLPPTASSLLASSSALSPSLALSTSPAPLSSSLSTLLLRNGDLQSTNSTEEVYLMSTFESSSQSSSTLPSQAVPISNSNQQIQETTIDISENTSLFITLFPETQRTSAEKHFNEKIDFGKMYESSAITPFQAATGESFTNGSSVHDNTGTPDLAPSEISLNKSAIPVKVAPVVGKKLELAIAYSTAAFEMETPYPDHSSHTTFRSSIFIVASLNGLCLFIIGKLFL